MVRAVALSSFLVLSSSLKMAAASVSSTAFIGGTHPFAVSSLARASGNSRGSSHRMTGLRTLSSMAGKNVFLVNGHQKWPFAKGELNMAFFNIAKNHFESAGYDIKETVIDDGWDVDAELEKYQWADYIFYQSPTFWMGQPWLFKKYFDEVFTVGMGGQLCNNDGRSSKSPEDNYGTGGTLNGKYMLSLTFNAPKGSFERPDEYLFQGKTVDDLWFPFHMNQRFCNLEQLPTFSAHDVLKNPKVEEDMERLRKHLAEHFPK